MNKLLPMLLSIILILCIIHIPAYAETSANTAVIIIDSLEVDNAGVVEVIGHATEWNVQTQITLLSMSPDALDSTGKIITGDKIIYINQMTVGNNGAFLFEFIIPEEFSETSAVLRIGSDTGASPVSKTYTVPKLPPTIENVSNNSVKYGLDVYNLDSSGLNATNVIDSISNGGNTIHYKIGDRWYDLLNEKATTSAYLVPENSLSSSEVSSFLVRYYYIKGVRITLRKK